MFHVKHRSPHILLINPWITDFAAYNSWIKPHGLLSIASLLRDNGFKITFIDCLDSTVTRKKYGDGKFHKIEIEKPLPIKSVPRKYSQYGIPEELFRDKLSDMEKPDLIGITSGMTYWYPGLFNCQLRIDDFPYPAFDLYPRLNYVSMMTSRGCPFQCSYCASPVMSKGLHRRNPLKVVEEIECWTSHYRVNNIAFYDDALLVNPLEHIIVILKEVKKRDIQCNFHTPNGLHVKEISKELADLLYHCRFKTLRLGLETSNEATQVETGGKVDNRSFKEAVNNLQRAGYSEKEIGVYIMAGLPGQRVGEVEESVAFVKESGAKPVLVEYSPIPKTPLFEKAKKMSKFDLENEPLFHNNSILPCQWEGFTLGDFKRLKATVKT